VTACLESPTDSHSLALVGGKGAKSNAKASSRMYSLFSLMTMPDEKFDVLGEHELELLTRRFERLHENRVNTRKNPQTCFQCGKPGHFVTDCLERWRTRTDTSIGRGQKTSTDQGANTSTRTRTRTSDDRERRTVATGRPEQWSGRVTSTPALPSLPEARVAAKMKVISARTRSHPRT
jgi:hypothetical protein